MVKLKNLLVEKKELGGAMIDKIYNLTDRNAHNMARETLAKAMGNKVLVKNYQALSTLHTLFRDMNDLNRKIAPLRPAVNSVLLDTSYLDIEQVFNVIKRIF